MIYQSVLTGRSRSASGGFLNLTLAQLVALAVLFVYFVVVFPPWQPRPLKYESLDGAYRAVLKIYAFGGLQFGQELITNTGPLGFLRHFDYWPTTHGWELAWTLLLAGVFAFAAARMFVGKDRIFAVVAVLLWIVLLLSAKNQVRRFLPLLGIFFIFLKAADRRDRLALWEICFAFALSVSSWILFTELLASCVAVAAVAVLHFLRTRRLSTVPLIYGGFLLGWWLLLGQRLTNLPVYFRSCTELASAYNDVMSRDCPPYQPLSYLLIFLVLAVGLLRLEDREHRCTSVVLTLAAAALFFLLWKSGFTRCHASRALNVGVQTGTMALCGFSLARRLGQPRRNLVLTACSVILSVFVTLVFIGDGGNSGQTAKHFRKAVEAQRFQLRDLVSRLRRPDEVGERHREALAQMRRTWPLPRIEGSVDYFGDRQGILFAQEEIDYRPRPVNQKYAAFTPTLAAINGDYYASEAAPDTVVVDFKNYGRFPPPLFDARAFLELFQSYALAERLELQKARLLLLERKPRDLFRLEKVHEARGSLGDVFEIAKFSAASPVWAEIEVPQNLLGRIASLLYKIPPLRIRIEFDEGGRASYRFAAAAGRGGFLLSPMIRNVGELERALDAGLLNASGPHVTTVRVSESSEGGDGTSIFRDEVALTLYALRPAE